jgi:hypothetical protein
MLSEAALARGSFLKSEESIEYHQKGSWNNVSTDQFTGESFLSITEEEALNRMEYNKKVFPLKFRFAEERFRVVESYATALTKWSHIRDNLVRPSLSVLFNNIVQAIAGTDVGSFEDVVQKARMYQGAMMAYLQPKLEKPEWFTRVLEYPDLQPTDQNMRYWQTLIEKHGERAVEKVLSWDRVAPLDLSSMPPPNIGFPGIVERTGRALIDGLILLGSTLFFLVLSIIRVIRYPIT